MEDDILHQSVEKLHALFDRTDIEVEWKKIQEKVEESLYNPGDLRPLADIIFSVLLAARSRGYDVDAVMKELHRVAENNMKRRWKKMENGTYRAI